MRKGLFKEAYWTRFKTTRKSRSFGPKFLSFSALFGDKNFLCRRGFIIFVFLLASWPTGGEGISLRGSFPPLQVGGRCELARARLWGVLVEIFSVFIDSFEVSEGGGVG